MDAFMNVLSTARTVKATARVKDGNTTKTVTFDNVVPGDLTDDAFMAAAKDGVSLSATETNGTRSRGITGKGVYGAAATSATAYVLGYRKADAVPESVKRRGKNALPEPSANGAPADGTPG